MPENVLTQVFEEIKSKITVSSLSTILYLFYSLLSWLIFPVISSFFFFKKKADPLFKKRKTLAAHSTSFIQMQCNNEGTRSGLEYLGKAWSPQNELMSVMYQDTSCISALSEHSSQLVFAWMGGSLGNALFYGEVAFSCWGLIRDLKHSNIPARFATFACHLI